jgi:hypothetical protein
MQKKFFLQNKLYTFNFKIQYMKKLNLIFILLSFTSFSLFSNSVDMNKALLVAQNFYKETTGKTTTLTLAYQSLNVNHSNGVAIGVPLYYVFNVSDNAGFVMVSADDLTKPIIGYGTSGQFQILNVPPVVSSWYDKYSMQIAYAKAYVTATSTDITNQWAHYSSDPVRISKQLRASAVGPLVTTTWDQDLYYNALCPSDPNSPVGYGGNVPTGCGATAMSQIMRYWSYPAQGTGNNSYSSNYGTLSANFGATTYNWTNMPNSVTSANSDVATIMYDCGVAVDMVYNTDESSSYMVNEGGVPASCEAAYTTYFGYNAATIQGLDRSNYNVESAWTALIDNELANNRPIQYAGSGPDGGHTFVLDGSDGNGNYHINWGWSGADNGFYSVDALVPAPYSNGSFSDGEQMLIGIQPPTSTVIASGIDLYEAITVNPDPIPFLTTFSVVTNLINDGTTSFTGSYCAALFDASGNFIRYIGPILNTGTNALPPTDDYQSGLTFTDTSTAVTVPGTYKVGIYYQPTGATTWSLAGPAAFSNPVPVTVSGPIDPGISLYSDIVATPSTFVEGQGASVNVNLINDGNGPYTGTYEAVLLDLQGYYVETIGTYTESNGLPQNEYYLTPYITFSTPNISAPEGQYILAIAEEASGSSNFYYCGEGNYSNPILINVVNSAIAVNTGINDVAGGHIKVYPNPATSMVTIDAGDVRGDYTLLLYNALGQQASQGTGTLRGQMVTTDVSNLAPGLYTIQLTTTSGRLTSKVVVK